MILIFLGSLNPYCEITVGTLTLKTPYAKGTNNPKWNTSMEFLIYDMVDDVIHVNIFDNEFFSPNGMVEKQQFFFLEKRKIKS